MSKLKTAVIKTGIVDLQQLAELARWGPMELRGDELDDPPDDADDAVDMVDDALQSFDQIELRDTDLDLGQRFLKERKVGRLFLFHEEQKTNFEVSFCRTSLGEYAIPWESESLSEILTNRRSYLKYGGEKIFFDDVRYLYYGDTRVFVACMPVKKRGKKDE